MALHLELKSNSLQVRVWFLGVCGILCRRVLSCVVYVALCLMAPAS